ncbi:MAG: DEAD/DEAH box helicase [Flavobacterium sp.]|uniref:DEAD/DEAH box helicase n=1 Tax=Flavobacterium sp. TaxID=239 RepID=UPI0011F79B1E|nr:DEAD/DEAH box helicase [Flavobacterium sp.]RZJ67022.1 MAG: DEAD/DEAH box helicase [Flavobacterium sp.]
MQLKKIHPNLEKALSEQGLSHATTLQIDTWSSIKSGADCVIASPGGSGKTTALVVNTIQKLQKPEGESTRALLLTQDKESVLELVEQFEKYGQYTGLRVIGSHDKGDIDYDKNMISLGMDVIVGTPTRVNALFASAGFNLTTIRFFAVDDADVLFKNRQDAIILRLAESVSKTQFIFTCREITERVEIIADKVMTEPMFFEPDDDQDDDATDEEE